MIDEVADEDDQESALPPVIADVRHKAECLHRSLKCAGLKSLPEGVELTLGELQEMACRQQHQIDSQQQLLVAKEQRLRFLKQQEARHHQVAAENDRLRRLRDRVEAQELKLRKLRALRGQVDQNKLNNASLTSDLDSIRALFNEKEKELSLAVAKVEELTRQLEELKRGRNAAVRDQQTTKSPAALELEKLRKELLYRNKINEQQNARLCQQREVLSQKQEEMCNVDKRISELQDRLHRKRLLNQQLANQITAASNNKPSGGQPPLRSVASASTIQQHGYQPPGPVKGKLIRPMTTGNIAAVEPYHHVPVVTNSGKTGSEIISNTNDLEKPHLRYQNHPYGPKHQLRNESQPIVSHTKNPYHQTEEHDLKNNHDKIISQDDLYAKLISTGGSVPTSNSIVNTNGNIMVKPMDKDEGTIPEFGGSKSDPKYQTLPYNTKFTVNFISAVNTKVGLEKSDLDDKRTETNEILKNSNNNIDNVNSINNNHQFNVNNMNQQQPLMTVHSVPVPALSTSNKCVAMPFSNQGHTEQTTYQHQPYQHSNSTNLTNRQPTIVGHIAPSRQFLPPHPPYVNPPGLTRGQPVGGTSSITSSTSSLNTNSSGSSSGSHQVPQSTAPVSVATFNQHTTSSTKLLGYGSVLPPTSLTVTNQVSQAPMVVSNTHVTTSTGNSRSAGYGPLLPPTPLTISNQKPMSSVAPTTVQHQKPSPIYQTSSTKIHPVQPQTLSSTPQGIFRDVRGEFSPPQSSSTPLGTPELHDGKTDRPALPPKPAVPVKPTPPPRQTQQLVGSEDMGIETAENLQRNRVGHAYQDQHHLSKLGFQQASHATPFTSSSMPLSGSDSDSIHHSPTTTYPPPPPPPPTSDPPEDSSGNMFMNQRRTGASGINNEPLPIIKARPLTIKKQPASELPKLKSSTISLGNTNIGGPVQNSANVHVSINRRIEMPPAFLFPETEAPPADLISSSEQSLSSNSTSSGNSNENSTDEVDRVAPVEPSIQSNRDENIRRSPTSGEEEDKLSKHEECKTDITAAVVDVLNNINLNQEQQQTGDTHNPHIVRRAKKGNLKGSTGKVSGVGLRRVSFDPLALLLDASLEGELELVRKTAGQVNNPSAANDEGITALHNAICAGHLEIVKFLVEFGCDVNAQDSDGWTPLHCAASCNNLAMVRFLVEHGACIFATTLSDHETAAEKCEEDEEGFDGCSEYLYSVQEKLGILNNGIVYAVYDYEAHNSDELSFKEGDKLVILRKGDEFEREWWWSRLNDQEGYVPRNLLGLYPRVQPTKKSD